MLNGTPCVCLFVSSVFCFVFVCCGRLSVNLQFVSNSSFVPSEMGACQPGSRPYNCNSSHTCFTVFDNHVNSNTIKRKNNLQSVTNIKSDSAAQ